MFCPIVGIIEVAMLPLESESFLIDAAIPCQWNHMSMSFVHFGCTLLLMMPSAVDLSIYIGVSGCGWPISMSICLSSTALYVLMHKALSSALDANEMTAFLISVMLAMTYLGD